MHIFWKGFFTIAEALGFSLVMFQAVYYLERDHAFFWDEFFTLLEALGFSLVMLQTYCENTITSSMILFIYSFIYLLIF